MVEPLQMFGNGRSERALEEIDPIITLQVRAYDLGIPSLDSQVDNLTLHVSSEL